MIKDIKVFYFTMIIEILSIESCHVIGYVNLKNRQII
jgi:hypothetical protein